MTTFSIVSIVLFSISGLLFIAAIIVFFTMDVLTSIKYLSSKDKSDQSSGVAAPSITIDHKSVNITPASNIVSSDAQNIRSEERRVGKEC